MTCTIDKVVETVYTYECRSHVYADKIFNRLSSPYCVQVDKLKYPSQFMVVLVDNRLITNATPHDIIMAAGSSALNSIRVIGKSLKLIPRSHLKRVRIKRYHTAWYSRMQENASTVGSRRVPTTDGDSVLVTEFCEKGRKSKWPDAVPLGTAPGPFGPIKLFEKRSEPWHPLQSPEHGLG